LSKYSLSRTIIKAAAVAGLAAGLAAGIASMAQANPVSTPTAKVPVSTTSPARPDAAPFALPSRGDSAEAPMTIYPPPPPCRTDASSGLGQAAHGSTGGSQLDPGPDHAQCIP
jgi:hypothetical protein